MSWEKCVSHGETLPLVRLAEMTEFIGRDDMFHPDCELCVPTAGLILRLPASIADALTDRGKPSSMKVLWRASPMGMPVICAAMQRGSVQLRAVMGWDDASRSWLSSLMLAERAGLCIDVEGRGPVRSSFDLTHGAGVGGLIVRQRTGASAAGLAVLEISEVASQLADFDAVPDLAGGAAIETLIIAVVSRSLGRDGTRAGERAAAQ